MQLTTEKQIEFEFESLPSDLGKVTGESASGDFARPKKRTVNQQVVLSERDLEVIQFILEMKFASFDNLHLRFFANAISARNEGGFHYAKKRLLRLERAKFIKATYSFSHSAKYYIATYKSYYALKQIKPDWSAVKPRKGFDQRTFEHDLDVCSARLLIEEKGLGSSWCSEKKLKSSPEFTSGLSSLYIPDAIYVDHGQRKVAFEIEIATKAKSRYVDKIKRYVNLMRLVDPTKRIFERCHYVCQKDSVAIFLRSQTKIYGELFVVQTYQEFFSQHDLTKKIVGG